MQMKKLSLRFQSIFCILYPSKWQSCYLGQIFLNVFFFNCGKSHIIENHIDLYGSVALSTSHYCAALAIICLLKFSGPALSGVFRDGHMLVKSRDTDGYMKTLTICGWHPFPKGIVPFLLSMTTLALCHHICEAVSLFRNLQRDSV